MQGKYILEMFFRERTYISKRVRECALYRLEVCMGIVKVRACWKCVGVFKSGLCVHVDSSCI